MKFLENVDWKEFHAWRKLAVLEEKISLLNLRLEAMYSKRQAVRS